LRTDWRQYEFLWSWVSLFEADAYFRFQAGFAVIHNAATFYNIVTHRMCTHRIQTVNIKVNAARYSHSVWPCNPSHPRGTGHRSGGGCGAMRTASDLLQRNRARSTKRLFGEYRKSCQGSKNAFARPFPAALTAFLCHNRQTGTKKMEFRPDHKFVVARRFKALRLKASISQSLLGEIIGICRQSVNEIENRRVMPHSSTWRKFWEFESRHNQPPMRLPVHWQ